MKPDKEQFKARIVKLAFHAKRVEIEEVEDIITDNDFLYKITIRNNERFLYEDPKED